MQAIDIRAEESCPITLRSVEVAAQRGGWTMVHRGDGDIVMKHVSECTIVIVHDDQKKNLTVDSLSDYDCVAALTVAWQEHAGIFRAICDRATDSGNAFTRTVLEDFVEFFYRAFGCCFVADTTDVPVEHMRLTLAQISTRPPPKSFVRERVA